MKKYILILSIAIIAVLNFTLVKSKTGDFNLKSITELAQANASESNPTYGEQITTLLSTTTGTYTECQTVTCNAKRNKVPCDTEFEICTNRTTIYYHYAVDEFSSYQNNSGQTIVGWHRIAEYTNSQVVSSTTTGECPYKNSHDF